MRKSPTKKIPAAASTTTATTTTVPSAVNAPVVGAPVNTAAKPSGLFLEGIRQHQRIHEKHLLMARVGDFYEFYFEQATVVSTALGLKIARASSAEHMFCGFPVYKRNDYVKALLQEGFSIAKYEQYENLQPNGDKILVRRVDRIYTAGAFVWVRVCGCVSRFG